MKQKDGLRFSLKKSTDKIMEYSQQMDRMKLFAVKKFCQAGDKSKVSGNVRNKDRYLTI